MELTDFEHTDGGQTRAAQTINYQLLNCNDSVSELISIAELRTVSQECAVVKRKITTFW